MIRPKGRLFESPRALARGEKATPIRCVIPPAKRNNFFSHIDLRQNISR